MATEVKLQRNGEQIQITFHLTLRPGTSMMDYEEQILEALNESGRLVTQECLEEFDTDGSPILLGGIKLTSKGRVVKNYQSPYGETGVQRHVYQSSEGGATFCPLDQKARIVNSTTPRFAKMCSSKYAWLNSISAQKDLSEKGVRVQTVLPGATATEFWDIAGYPPQKTSEITMSAEDCVDAALAALDGGELVTIPGLHDEAPWTRWETDRREISPKFRNAKPAPRYGVGSRASNAAQLGETFGSWPAGQSRANSTRSGLAQ